MVNRIYLVFLSFTLLLLPFRVTDAAVTFTVKPTDPSYFDKGSTATLVWDYDDQQGEVQGIKFLVRRGIKFEAILAKVNGVVSDIPPEYQGRVKVEGTATLVIGKLTSQDNTQFMCRLLTRFRSPQNAINVIVTEQPDISPSFEVNKNVNEGNAVDINCTVTGNPIPTVIWIRKGTRLTKSSGKGEAYFTFDNISRSDAGKYVCEANNTAGSIQKELTIRVNYKPEGTTLATNGDQNTFTQGETVTFFCKVTAAVPQVSVYKFYLNNSFLSESNISEYTIKDVNRSQHHGRYKCIPHNVAGDGQEASVTLVVHVPAQFTEIPQNETVNVTNLISLRCDASGYPVPNITWKKLGKKLSHERQLIIPRSSKSDAGEYLCASGNGVGNEKTVRAHVTVQYPPTIQIVTTSSKKSWIGQTVTLKCQSDGVPTPILTWYKPNGSEISSVRARKNEVKLILMVDREFGVYKCLATNGLYPPSQRAVEINQIREPGQASIKLSESDIQATFVTISWTTPADDGGSPITAYRVIMLKDDTEIGSVNITDPEKTTSSFSGLNKDTSYTVKVFSRNSVFEGDPVVQTIKTKFEGAPGVVKIDKLPGETSDDTIILKWKEPANNGKVIMKYKVYQRVVTDGIEGEWTELETITDVSVRELEIALERGKVYQFAVTAANELGESLKQEKANIPQIKAGESPTKRSRAVVDNEVNTTIFAGAAVAGGLLIIGVIVIIVIWKRRKRSNGENDQMSVGGRGSAHHYEADDGYQEVSRAEAAQSLQVSSPEAEANYAQVDMTKKKKNRPPPSDEYARVNKSKKTKNRLKRPGELDYAELGDLRAGLVRGPSGATAAAAVVRPPVYEGTDYADITQFGIPQPDPTYANVSKGDVAYSNMQSIQNLRVTVSH